MSSAKSASINADPSSELASPTAGDQGLDIFKMAGKTISGWLPYGKTAVGKGFRKALPYATLQERDALLYQAFHPLVGYTQRGDIGPSFATAHRLELKLRAPYTIPYRFDGADHLYYIDWVGLLTSGAPYGLEASVEDFKSDAQSEAKLAAAAMHFTRLGGWFGLFLPDVVSDIYLFNLRRLNAYLLPFVGYDEVATEIELRLLQVEPVSIRELVAALGPRFGERLVAESAWRRIAIAAMEGRLVVDLDAVLLDLDTPLQLLPPSMAPATPPRLPVSIAEIKAGQRAPEPKSAGLLPGETVDPNSLPEPQRSGFIRNLRIVFSVLAGSSHAEVGKVEGLGKKQVERLVRRGQTGGEEALVPYIHHGPRQTEIDPIFVDLVRKLVGRKNRDSKLSYVQITESAELKKAAMAAFKATGALPTMPTHMQVYRYAKDLEKFNQDIRNARAGLVHIPHSATSILGYVRTIPSPMLILNVDEHWMDVFVVTDEGAALTERVHAAVLIDVKTGAIVAAVLSPRALTEEDYLRLIKQAMEPKDEILRRFKCLNPWPCYGRPVEILTDRGKAVTSELGTLVLVDRFGINQSFAPPYAPSVKGVVESLFRWITERFAHRLVGTTKSSPADRGTYQSQAEALRGGITFTDLEELFYRAIVDGYMQDWDNLRTGQRLANWESAAAQFGVPQSMVSSDELKLLLMRGSNPKHAKGLYLVQGGGVSFKGNWYVGEEGLTARLRDDYVGVLWDKRDIGTIYLIDENSVVLGAASCPKYASRRISIWEQEAERRDIKTPKRAAHRTSSDNLTTIIGDSQTKARERKRLAKQGSRARFLDAQQEEIHTTEALAERRRIAKEQKRGPAWQTDPSTLPGPDTDMDEPIVIPLVRRRVPREVD